MKFKFIFSINDAKLPFDYRRGIASLLKEAIKNGNEFLFDEYYLQKRGISKPFTFSVFFNKHLGVSDDKYFLVTDSFDLNFSTNDISLSANLYNGMMRIDTFNLFGNDIKLKKIFAFPHKKIDSDISTFNILSPILINDKQSSNKYITPKDENFKDNFIYYANELSKLYLKKNLELFEYNIHKIKKSVYSHYGQAMPGITGIIEIKSNREFLNLINEIGIGDRRSQGFGMLEVIKCAII